MTRRLVPTPSGEARTTTADPAATAVGTLVLGHGAGGLRWTEDVTAVLERAVADGWRVVLVDQPWRVAGRRLGPGPLSLDPAWRAALGTVDVVGPLVVGGRSAGARVACRTAADVRARAVLALSFPLHPQGHPERSRASELALPGGAGIPVHVVQGRADPLGTSEEVRAALPPDGRLASVEGTHSLERSAPAVAEAAAAALAVVLGSGPAE